MFISLIVWKKYLKFDAGANDTKRHGNLWKFTERIVDVPVVQREQVQQPDTGSYDPKVQTKMC